MIDRSIPPTINAIPDTIPIGSARIKSDQGIDIHCIPSSLHDVVRVELAFRAGRIFERKKVAAILFPFYGGFPFLHFIIRSRILNEK